MMEKVQLRAAHSFSLRSWKGSNEQNMGLMKMSLKFGREDLKGIHVRTKQIKNR